MNFIAVVFTTTKRNLRTIGNYKKGKKATLNPRLQDVNPLPLT